MISTLMVVAFSKIRCIYCHFWQVVYIRRNVDLMTLAVILSESSLFFHGGAESFHASLLVISVIIVYLK